MTWLSYADRLMEFPTALLGVALGSVLLPSLSRAYARGDTGAYQDLLDTGLKVVFLLAVPAAVGLGFLAEGLSSVLFHSSKILLHHALCIPFASTFRQNAHREEVASLVIQYVFILIIHYCPVTY